MDELEQLILRRATLEGGLKKAIENMDVQLWAYHLRRACRAKMEYQNDNIDRNRRRRNAKRKNEDTEYRVGLYDRETEERIGELRTEHHGWWEWVTVERYVNEEWGIAWTADTYTSREERWKIRNRAFFTYKDMECKAENNGLIYNNIKGLIRLI